MKDTQNTKVIWKPLKGFSINYIINNYGVVKNIGTDKILKPNVLKSGYLRYILRIKGGKRKTCLVHRLVAMTFIPNPDNLPDVDHINCCRTDNRVENLRWCTVKENRNNPITIQHIIEGMNRVKDTDAFKRSRKIAVNNALILYSKHVVCLETGEWFVSALDASKFANISSTTVLNYCKRFASNKVVLKRKGSTYHFRYATEEENAINIPKYREKIALQFSCNNEV